MLSLCSRIWLIFLVAFSAWPKPPLLEQSITNAMAHHSGTCVFIDCNVGTIISSNAPGSLELLTPCSTFKIWNTLIGAELGLLSSPEEPFFTWDNEIRFIPEWNRNLSLREAFQVSCVPAFQNLARKIGPETMQAWLDTIGYGDRDRSSGIDIFWLPREGRKSILISPKEQAVLIQRLITGKLPFSEKAVTLLKQVMVIKESSAGTLYGKTGTGDFGQGESAQRIGWFVGFVESLDKRYSYACVLKGEKVSGKDARRVIETILMKSGLVVTEAKPDKKLQK